MKSKEFHYTAIINTEEMNANCEITLKLKLANKPLAETLIMLCAIPNALYWTTGEVKL